MYFLLCCILETAFLLYLSRKDNLTELKFNSNLFRIIMLELFFKSSSSLHYLLALSEKLLTVLTSFSSLAECCLAHSHLFTCSHSLLPLIWSLRKIYFLHEFWDSGIRIFFMYEFLYASLSSFPKGCSVRPLDLEN